MIVEIIKSIILGIIQGITEWLPISSTGHMLLANEFLKMDVSQDFMKMFEVVIQLGSILAVVVLFFNKLNPFSLKKTGIEKKETWSMWLRVLIGIIPAGIIGILLDDIISEHLGTPFIIAFTLILYGILFIVVESRKMKPNVTEISDLTYNTALFIGMFQVLALIPGTSRSGATIIGAMLIGTSRIVAAEYSFFMSIPMMFGASGLRLLKYILKGAELTSTELSVLIAGSITAFVVSLVVIKALMSFIKKHDFKIFGYYRIALGALVLLYFFVIPK